MAAVALRDEVTELLQELIRVDTTNPPGNETAAAELLRDYLEDERRRVRALREGAGAREPRRADSRPRRRAEAALPVAHRRRPRRRVRMDRRPVRRRAARRRDLGSRRARHEGPGRGERRCDRLAGARGLRARRRPDLRATADEEVGDGFGAPWLCEAHPDAVRCDYLINEGSGDRSSWAGKPFYLCSIAEKMSAPFLLRVRGRSGHASMPGDRGQRARQGGAADRAACGLQAGARADARGRGPPGDRHRRAAEHAGARARAGARDRRALAELVEPLLSLTLSPTIVDAPRDSGTSSPRSATSRSTAGCCPA